MSVISEILKPDVNILWDIYREANIAYRDNPTRENRAVWETSYIAWRRVFLNAV